VPMALGGGGAFRTLASTRHTTTNFEVIQQFTGRPIAPSRAARDDVVIEIPSPV